MIHHLGIWKSEMPYCCFNLIISSYVSGVCWGTIFSIGWDGCCCCCCCCFRKTFFAARNTITSTHHFDWCDGRTILTLSTNENKPSLFHLRFLKCSTRLLLLYYYSTSSYNCSVKLMWYHLFLINEWIHDWLYHATLVLLYYKIFHHHHNLTVLRLMEDEDALPPAIDSFLD